MNTNKLPPECAQRMQESLQGTTLEHHSALIEFQSPGLVVLNGAFNIGDLETLYQIMYDEYDRSIKEELEPTKPVRPLVSQKEYNVLPGQSEEGVCIKESKMWDEALNKYG